MAFELIGNFTSTAGAGETQLDTYTDQRPYAATLRLIGFDTCTVAVEWRALFNSDSPLAIWASGDITVAGTQVALMTPVVPLARQLELWFNLISGTATTSQVEWDLFGL